jgi:hypothetical protein
MKKQLALLAFLTFERVLVRLAFPGTTRAQRRVVRIALRVAAERRVAAEQKVAADRERAYS